MFSPDIPIGVSACVVGERVRFDAGHKTHPFIARELSAYFRFIPVCPEVGMGMSVPRPAIRLVSDGERIALREAKEPQKDHTQAMLAFSAQKISQLSQLNLCGYLVCAKSPTCGMEKVKVYKKTGVEKEGTGLYTQALMSKMPWLPVEEDGRLNDPVLRENFIARVFCLYDFYNSVSEPVTAGKIVAFHSRYKLTLMAHNPEAYRTLGQMVAGIGRQDIQEFYAQYRLSLMQALAGRASRKNHTNVLMHLQGYFKKVLDKPRKAELSRLIDEYRKGELPLLVPLTLIKHYQQHYPDPYLVQQRYLEPYPQELKLRYGL